MFHKMFIAITFSVCLLRAVAEDYYLYDDGGGGGGCENIALNKPVYSSSIYKGFTLKGAVDGNFNTGFNTAKSDMNPWITIDLQKSQKIKEVKILPYSSWSTGKRFRNVEVVVGDSIDSKKRIQNASRIGNYVGPYVKDRNYVKFPVKNGISARYVGVRKYGKIVKNLEVLGVFEIEIIQ